MRKTTEQCIAEFENVHGTGRWDYSQVVYVNATTPVTIRCPQHDEVFTQLPQNHRRGQVGCPQCFSRRLSDAEFLRRARERFGENRYDYSGTQYQDMYTTITVRCPEHGEFEQLPVNHLRGAEGCGGCRDLLIDTESFLQKSFDTWGDRWDYSGTEYINQKVKVRVTCRTHGSFFQDPRSHVKGMVGCSGCNGMSVDTGGFIRRAAEVFPQKSWNYTQTEYVTMKQPITILCEKHGEFTQSPEKHLVGQVGCSSCQSTGSSRKEQEVAAFVESLGLEYWTKRRDLLGSSRLEVDIYIPSLKVAIEFNGLYYHSSKFKDSKYHYEKSEAAKKAGIRLLQVWEDDWQERPDIVKEHIRQVLKVSALPRIAARKTEVVELSSREAQQFLNHYHIQGFQGAAHYLGLEFESAVVAVVAFKRRGGDFELVRYATSANVQGGHSKLVSYFEKNFTYEKLVTFADNTFSDGGLYQSTGWEEDGFVRPDYSYLVGGRRVHKFNYRLKRFREDPQLHFREGLSESQLAELNGLLKIHDAGKVRYTKHHPSRY